MKTSLTGAIVFTCFMLSLISSGNTALILKTTIDEAVKAVPKDVRGPNAKSFAESSEIARVWRQRITLEYYEKSGIRDPRWDADALVALKEFADLGAARDQRAIDASLDRLDKAIRAVKKADCKDPLLNFIFVRITRPREGVDWKTYAEELKPVTNELQASKAPDSWKSVASYCTANAIFNASKENRRVPFEFFHYLKNSLDQHFRRLTDPTLPAEEFFVSSERTLSSFKMFIGYCEEAYLTLEPLLLARWPDDARSYLTMGDFYIAYAWRARGSGFANEISEESWKEFEKRLKMAETHLEKAWKIDPTDPRIAKAMLSVEKGQGQGRDRMEQWFARGMKLSPNDSGLVNSKLNYLEPKWHGSELEMLAFGRECVANAEWGGDVPLTLVRIHTKFANDLQTKEEQAEYWKQAAVWQDVKLAYTRHFKDQPDADRQPFIKLAYACEQWDVLHTELKALKKPNLELFGGKEEFDRMSHLAEKNSAISDDAI